MAFLYAHTDLLSVPGKMDLDELGYLGALAAQVPHAGRIVEIGPFFGRSTNAIARANPRAEVTSIDTFEPAPWTDRYTNTFKNMPRFGRRAFESYTSHLPNITPIKGFSPDIAEGWQAPIDLYFEDAIHGNPGFLRNLTFWTTHLRPGGVVCGHDYTRRFPDIKREVAKLASLWGNDIHVVGSLWALQKPAQQGSPNPICPEIPFRTDGTLVVGCKNRRAGETFAREGYWCGAHLEADRLNAIRVTAPKDLTCHIEIRFGHDQFGDSDWMPADDFVRFDVSGKSRPFTRLAVRAHAPGRGPINISYRVSARQIGQGGDRLSGTSQWACNGDWAKLSCEGPALNAITVILGMPPPGSQSAFQRKQSMKIVARSRALAKRVLARV